MSRHHRVRAVAIILKDDLLLVMYRNKRGSKYYTLPGGGVETDETPKQAVLREIDEETSLKINIDREIYQHHYDNGQKQYFFLCHYLSGRPLIKSEVNEAVSNQAGDFHKPVWIKLDELPSTLLYPLEIRDWLIKDWQHGFPTKPRVARIKLSELRHTL